MQITDNVLYGIIGACVLYLIVMYILQKIKAGINSKRIKKAQASYEEARVALNQQKQKLIDQISFIYGAEQAHYVSMGKLWVGMPQHLLMVARGKANNIKQSVGVDMITQTWHYTEHDKTRGTKQNLEVLIVNNQVNSWKESV